MQAGARRPGLLQVEHARQHALRQAVERDEDGAEGEGRLDQRRAVRSRRSAIAAAKAPRYRSRRVAASAAGSAIGAHAIDAGPDAQDREPRERRAPGRGDRERVRCGGRSDEHEHSRRRPRRAAAVGRSSRRRRTPAPWARRAGRPPPSGAQRDACGRDGTGRPPGTPVAGHDVPSSCAAGGGRRRGRPPAPPGRGA